MHTLLNSLDQKSVILTVNRRLSRTLIRLSDQQRIASGATVWPTPRILPLSTWLEQCWAELLDHRQEGPSAARSRPLTLLTPWQERLLWEKIIAASPEGAPLLRVSEAARTARQAWSLLKEWQLTLHESDLYDHEDAQAFYAWSTQFASFCRKQGWLDQASLPELLRQNLSQLSLPERIFLSGFQDHPPILTALFSALTEAGVILEPLPLPSQPSHAQRLALPSPEAELLAAAQWARSVLSQAPEQRIGIVVPNLEILLPKVIDSFSRTLYPGANPATLEPGSKLFNISLGARLTETPLVRDALLLLTLSTGALSLEQYTQILHSPFWQGGTSEWPARSLLDARLRSKGFFQIRSSQLRREAARADRQAPACPLLAATLSGFITLLSDPNKGETSPAKPSVWMDRFSRWLTRLGWPGERTLSSSEYQNVVAWREGLVLFSTLDRVTGPLPLAEALALLQRLLGESTFQPESETAPIQIMGMLEAVGENPTHLWMTGLSAEGWPPPLEPNPLLPIPWQRRHGLPHAAFEREAAYHQTLFQNLLEMAETVVCSHPLWNGDQPLRPTPMILSLPPGHLDTLLPETLPEYNTLLLAAGEQTTLFDEQGPPYPVATATPVGTSVLQAQAVCPFQAFARFRLGAQPREEPSVGLDPSQRGQLVHAALNQLWHHLGTEKTDLQHLDPTDNPVIRQAVQESLEQAAQQWPEPLHPFFRQLEASRLQRLLQAVLEMEKGRVLPFTVIGQEVEKALSLGELIVRVRLDRIDQLPDGSLVILDYKTGQTRVTDWLGDRPPDPQLPLYLLAQEEQPVAALVFCQVRAGDCQFSGLASQEGLLPKVAHFQKYAPDFAEWRGLVASWRSVLTALGARFVRGDAQVDPVPGGCRYCDLPPLCRCHEAATVGTEEEDLT